MKFCITFLAENDKMGIEQDYIWIAEKRGAFWLIQSPDIDYVAIICHSRYHGEAQAREFIRMLWARSNVYVTVKKYHSSLVSDSQASL